MMNNEKTEAQIKEHIEKLIGDRKDYLHLAPNDFNNGVKFTTDYILEFINTKRLTVFVDKERKEIARQIETALRVIPSCEFNQAGLHYITYCKAYPYIVTEYQEIIEGLIEYIYDYHSLELPINKGNDLLNNPTKTISSGNSSDGVALSLVIHPSTVISSHNISNIPDDLNYDKCKTITFIMIYWKELPVIEKTNTATYIRATFALI